MYMHIYIYICMYITSSDVCGPYVALTFRTQPPKVLGAGGGPEKSMQSRNPVLRFPATSGKS